MAKDSGHHLESIAVDGGMSASDLCMQTQADIIQMPVVRPAMRETTALGAAIAAALAVGVWSENQGWNGHQTAGDEVSSGIPITGKGGDDQTIFKPQWSPSRAEKEISRWERAVEMCRGWVVEEGMDSEQIEQGEQEDDEEEENVRDGAGTDIC